MAREVCLANAPPADERGEGQATFRMLEQDGRRQLMEAYTASQSKLKPACHRSEVADFRIKNAMRLGEAPKLLPVLENSSVTTAGWLRRRVPRLLRAHLLCFPSVTRER
jgi:hypothetical protein